MRKLLFGLLALAMVATPAFAGHNADSTIWGWTALTIDSGWYVGAGAGGDYFSVAYFVDNGNPLSNNQRNILAQALPVSGVAVSVADFASGDTYPAVGVYRTNTGLSPITPDLSQPISETFSPTLPSGIPLYQYVCFDSPEGAIPAGDVTVVAAVKDPEDGGALGIGADSGAGQGTTGFTTDSYTTPAISATFLDQGINVGQDNSATTACKPSLRIPHGRLRVDNEGTLGIGNGDDLTVVAKGGTALKFAFFGSKSGDIWQFWYNLPGCLPVLPIGPYLPTVADGDGDGSYLRIGATWPSGFGGLTFQFSAVWGNPGCLAPGAGFTNCITVITLPDPPSGVITCDDGTYESGWVVSIPAGPSDYFDNDYAGLGGANGVTHLSYAIRDFVTTASAFPSAGIAPPDLVTDPAGNSPNLGAAWANIAYTFPVGQFDYTTGTVTSNALPGGGVGSGTIGANKVLAYVQFPPGDYGALGIGGDTNSGSSGCSNWTLNGYSTPAYTFFVNWGMRLFTN